MLPSRAARRILKEMGTHWTRSLALGATAAVALVRCGIDSSLICGDACGDASIDVTVPSDARADTNPSDSGSPESSPPEGGGNDGEAGCPVCTNGSQACCAPAYCSQGYCCHLSGDSCGQGSCCSGLVCTAANQCASSCHDAGGSCSTNNDCCRHERCDAGTCVCNANGTACAQDQDCCSNNCNYVDGGMVCGP